MNEPRRLRDDPGSPLERSLLEAGRGYTASAATRRRALAALGVASVATSGTAAATSLTKAGIAKWAVAVALVGGGAVTAAHFLAQPSPASAPLAGTVVPAPSVQPQPAPVVAKDPEPAPVAADAPSPSAPVSAQRVEPKTGAPALSAELSALDAARSSLSARDPKSALTALDAYARNFPHGKLAIEAEVLRIDALAKSGQTAAARSRAEAFIKRHPDSVLASRVRSSVGL
ncbi:MAG: hypothetical protein ABUL62_08790 [Myxococcales bacterium]